MMTLFKPQTIHWIIVLHIILQLQVVVSDWASGDSCSNYKECIRKPKEITSSNKYGLWPGLTSSSDLENGEVIFGFDEAMEAIWRNQNPSDCSKAKYLILEGWMQGFGSEFHIYGVGLAAAIDSGRVLLQQGGWQWRFKNPFCREQKKNSLECYFLPWSNCTIHDAAKAMDMKEYEIFERKSKAGGTPWNDEMDQKLYKLIRQHGIQGTWTTISSHFPDKTSTQCIRRWREVIRPKYKALADSRKDMRWHDIVHVQKETIFDLVTPNSGTYGLNRIKHSTVKNDRMVFYPNHTDRFSHTVYGLAHEQFYFDNEYYVPSQFLPMLKCSGLDRSAYYLWWRAIAAAFMLRPNNATLDFVYRNRDPLIASIDGQCISTYVRHGDKGIEMKLVPFGHYAKQAKGLWDSKDIPGFINYTQPKVFYVASEDFEVYKEANAWGAKENVMVRRSNLSALVLSDRMRKVKQHDLERSTAKSRTFEYLSYILHLNDLSSCEAAICTMPSNYCRLVDELRSTVGGKANRISIDLSVETCKTGPVCIRRNSLGNYVGKVHDPLLRLWR